MKTWWFYATLFALFVLYTVQIVLAALRLSAVILWPWYWVCLPLLVALIIGVVVSLWFLLICLAGYIMKRE